ncbi:hypothetical protein [Chitinophaga qingshengii]|uniref:TonB-dependent receptor n=1 Tax=Chitinophaga qingshengii TaxID=1569794 RepID=A0ABR7TEZ1_9BACT|nr:hypothetical protein [Chitinophaga qingshengii]MBC9928868.1 hypothetical protein [Chitinophaga qingshengii]
MKYCLLLLLIPAFLHAQEQDWRTVEPIVSEDYRALLRQSTPLWKDSTRLQSGKFLRSGESGQFSPFKRPVDLKVSKGTVKLVYIPKYRLRFSGSFGNIIEVKSVYRIPGLQQEYVQGRSVNGGLQWRGAETGEMFSYGPALRTLVFDGTAYPYDGQGKLTPAGAANGTPAVAYENSIFRPAVNWRTGLALRGAINKQYKEWVTLKLDLEHSDAGMVVRYNNDHTNKLMTSAGMQLNKFNVNLGYQYRDNHATTNNRNGFLNRAWQQSLLTPASFDNAYSGKAYGREADNPLTLLKYNGNHYTEYNHGYSVTVNYKSKKLTAGSDYAGVTGRQYATETYPPGMSGIPPEGFRADRDTRLQQHILNTYLTCKIGNNEIYTEITARHIFSAIDNVIGYTPSDLRYQYRRTANEFMLEAPFYFQLSYKTKASVEVGNRAYLSNTARKREYWLPSAGASIVHEGYSGFKTRVFSRWNQTARELPLDKSLAYLQLTRYNANDVRSYFATTEVAGYDQERAVRSREWSTGLEISYRRLSMEGAVYGKKILGDQFPAYIGNEWKLAGLADHRTTGYELTLRLVQRYWNYDMLDYAGSISLNGYRNKVTDIVNGGDYTPIAGFRDVNIALVKGEPFGVIVGSTWRRDAAGRLVIGPDGFPMAAAKGIIGNPNPDFILKHNSRLFWRKWQLDAALEWKKGGRKWNGTQAMLDYYGRSQVSGNDRNITGYVFNGVTEDGRPNTKPVAFYDPGRPMEENRWVRYGPGGVAEDYVQQADYLRLNTVQLSYRWNFSQFVRELTVAGYVNNLLLWTPYKGGDPAQLLFDYPNSTGLDFFNLPAVKTFGCNVLIKF